MKSRRPLGMLALGDGSALDKARVMRRVNLNPDASGSGFVIRTNEGLTPEFQLAIHPHCRSPTSPRRLDRLGLFTTSRLSDPLSLLQQPPPSPTPCRRELSLRRSTPLALRRPPPLRKPLQSPTPKARPPHLRLSRLLLLRWQPIGTSAL